ncbi:metallophosphoesterase [Patescibacteria group bacterium]|nr:metallophosphoesterase [Patescibacteria group bacterium]MBU1674046.1 metallophosphoesterase [Patescibacteria group bacterium]MBU1963194.1 metallophosphoesterase [Patescibacteria group bacterium]
MNKIIGIILIILAFIFTGAMCEKQAAPEQGTLPPESVSQNTPADFKVAFIGDEGVTEDSKAVLNMVKDEEAELLVIAGDLGYSAGPHKWEDQLNSVLGPDFPVFAIMGNHDESDWTAYRGYLNSRLANMPGAECVGDLGRQSACTYNGLLFVTVDPGFSNKDHAAYLDQQLTGNDSDWKICLWHLNNRLMQVGDKETKVDIELYDTCRQAGAFTVSGHDHSYGRTHLMDNFTTQSIASTSDTLDLTPKNGFAVISGLGGKSVYGQDDQIAAEDWWASVYTKDQDATFGALFCEFNYQGAANQAHCYFKNINGEIIDEFNINK